MVVEGVGQETKEYDGKNPNCAATVVDWIVVGNLLQYVGLLVGRYEAQSCCGGRTAVVSARSNVLGARWFDSIKPNVIPPVLDGWTVVRHHRGLSFVVEACILFMEKNYTSGQLL